MPEIHTAPYQSLKLLSVFVFSVFNKSFKKSYKKCDSLHIDQKKVKNRKEYLAQQLAVPENSCSMDSGEISF